MACGVVLVAMVAGLWAADAERWGPMPAALGPAVTGVAIGLALHAAALLGQGGAGRAGAPTGRLILLLCVGAVATGVATHDRLARRIAAARLDERRAWALVDADPQAIRRIEATVAERRGSALGETWILEAVVATDAGPTVPRRLLLRGDPIDTAPADDAWRRPDALLLPGERVRLGVRVRPLLGQREPGRTDPDRDLRRRGLGATARLVDPAWVVGVEPASPAARAARWRQLIRRIFRERASRVGDGEGVGLVAALALGDRRRLALETMEALRQLGLAHVVAISGLHVGLVGVGAAWVMRLAALLPAVAPRPDGCVPRLVDPFPVIAAGAAVVSWVYGWLAGAPPSVQRAGLLLTLACLARALGRPVTPWRALVLAAIVLLATQPSLFFDLGARLSFAACMGLASLGWRTSRIERRLPGVGRRLGEALGWSMAAALATAPLVHAAGGPVPPWGPVVNLLAVPLVALLVLPVALISVLAALVGVEEVLGAGLALMAQLERGTARIATALPEPSTWAWTSDLDPGWGAWLLALAAGAALLLLRGGRYGPAVAAWLLVAGLAAGAPYTGAMPLPVPRVVFLDVGQGDAALVQGRESSLLIDSGGGRPGPWVGGRLERSLRRLGVRALDLMVVSHGDWDHRGGATRILERLPVRMLALPSAGRADPALVELAERAGAIGTDVVWMASGDRRSLAGEIEIEAIWPGSPPRAPGSSAGGRGAMRGPDRNDRSLVLRVGLDGLDYLFAADVGHPVEGQLIASDGAIRADVLKVAHHGSRGSSSRAFLRAVDPSLLILSAPCLATRGLPDPEIVERLVDEPGELAWTGRDGPVFVARGPPGEGPRWRTGHLRRACPRASVAEAASDP